MPMISPDEAWQRIAAQLAARAPLGTVQVARRQAAGRILAAPLAATVDVPGSDVSAMDGYAVTGECPPGTRLPVAATVAAGDPPGVALAAGQAMRIMTGAPLPLGADRVIPVEATVAVPAAAGGPQGVELLAAPQPGDHIRRRGEIQRAGDPLLPAGALLTPGALALLATHGHATLPVHRAPAVAVLATGDEVVPADRVPGPGQLRDSHTDFLLTAGAALGLSFHPLGIAPDRTAELTALVRQGLEADVLLVCGGVSMGDFDLVEGVLERLGCRRHFDAVAVQPGKPLVFATHPGGLVFGLPGNPASVMVDFWLFVRPALLLLSGRDAGAVSWWAPAIPATLASPLAAAGPRDRFLAAEVRWGAGPGGGPLVTPRPPRGSHDLVSYAHGTALLRVRAGAGAAPAGAPCEILPLPGQI
jgi:molybdopterin molybdotransferase